MRTPVSRALARFSDWSILTRYLVVAVLAHLGFLVWMGQIRIPIQLPAGFGRGFPIHGEPITGTPGQPGPTSGEIGTGAGIKLPPLGSTLDGPGNPLAPGTLPPSVTTLSPPPVSLPEGGKDIFRVEDASGSPTRWEVRGPGTVALDPMPGIGDPHVTPGLGPGDGPGQRMYEGRNQIKRPGSRPGPGGNGTGTDWGTAGDERSRIWSFLSDRTDKTESAVTAALRWLNTEQRADGSWGTGTQAPAISALALLCFFGRAENSDSPEFGRTIDKGLRYLVTTVKSDGVVGGMYDQGIVGIALAEASILTREPSLREPLQRVVDVILRAQNVPKLDPSDKGGWRYTHTSTDADLSVAGWQIMALKSAAAAGIDVPSAALSNAVEYVWNRYGGPGFAYAGRGTTYGMTGVGVLCQFFLGNGHDDRLDKALDYLAATRVDWEKAGQPSAAGFTLYGWYYAALALHQSQGAPWRSWNRTFQKALVDHQHDDGYWEAPGERERDLGRVYSTALCTLMLEVYYRYLPMYRAP